MLKTTTKTGRHKLHQQGLSDKLKIYNVELLKNFSSKLKFKNSWIYKTANIFVWTPYYSIKNVKYGVDSVRMYYPLGGVVDKN